MYYLNNWDLVKAQLKLKEVMDNQTYKEKPWSVCPVCYTPDFGGGTVVNGVDEVLQLPSFLERMKQFDKFRDKTSHGHIVVCDQCETVYEVETGIVLTPHECDELEKLWEDYENDR